MTEPVLYRLKCNHLLIWSLLIAIIVQSSDSEVVHVNPYGTSPEKFNWRLRWEFSGSKLQFKVFPLYVRKNFYQTFVKEYYDKRLTKWLNHFKT